MFNRFLISYRVLQIQMHVLVTNFVQNQLFYFMGSSSTIMAIIVFKKNAKKKTFKKFHK